MFLNDSAKRLELNGNVYNITRLTMCDSLRFQLLGLLLFLGLVCLRTALNLTDLNIVSKRNVNVRSVSIDFIALMVGSVVL